MQSDDSSSSQQQTSKKRGRPPRSTKKQTKNLPSEPIQLTIASYGKRASSIDESSSSQPEPHPQPVNNLGTTESNVAGDTQSVEQKTNEPKRQVIAKKAPTQPRATTGSTRKTVSKKAAANITPIVLSLPVSNEMETTFNKLQTLDEELTTYRPDNIVHEDPKSMVSLGAGSAATFESSVRVEFIRCGKCKTEPFPCKECNEKFDAAHARKFDEIQQSRDEDDFIANQAPALPFQNDRIQDKPISPQAFQSLEYDFHQVHRMPIASTASIPQALSGYEKIPIGQLEEHQVMQLEEEHQGTQLEKHLKEYLEEHLEEHQGTQLEEHLKEHRSPKMRQSTQQEVEKLKQRIMQLEMQLNTLKNNTSNTNCKSNDNTNWKSNGNQHECLWHLGYFDGTPVGLPVHYDDATCSFDETIGCFCSYQCAYAYRLEHKSADCAPLWMLFKAYRETAARSGQMNAPKLAPAPPRQALRRYGGKMDYDQFLANATQWHRLLRMPFIPSIEYTEQQQITGNNTATATMVELAGPVTDGLLVRKREKPHPNAANQWGNVIRKTRATQK